MNEMAVEGNKEIFSKYIAIFKTEELPFGEVECKKLKVQFSELSELVLHLNDFIEFCLKLSLAKSVILARLIELIVGFGTVGFADSQEKEYQEGVYPHTSLHAEKCFEYCETILKYFEELECSDKRHVIISCIILCATHSEKHAWSSEASVTASSDFLKLLLNVTNHDSLSSLLCGDNFYPTIFKGTLKKLRPSLMKDTWLKFPSSCYVFSWILKHVKHPYLADYLSEVFPPPCMFISDHQLHHQIVAVQCFEHILDNVPPTLIKLDGKDHVIYSLLSPYVHSSQDDIIAIVPSCLLKLPTFKSQNLSQVCWTSYDELLRHLLVRAEMEHKKKTRRIYLHHILSYIQVVPPFKHLKLLFKVIDESLTKDEDIVCHKISLTILKDVIKYCWPRMEKYCFSMLKSILFFFIDVEDGKYQDFDEEKKNLLDLCKECLHLLRFSCLELFQEILSQFIEDDDVPGVETLRSVLQEE